MDLHTVILAGGRGERFWPLSRSGLPKQMLRLVGEDSLLGVTLRRVAVRVPAGRTWMVIGRDLRPALERLALPLPEEQIVWESVGRNTAAAIGAAVERILLEGDAAVLALPSDHWIPDDEEFWRTVDQGMKVLATGEPLVTFGVAPVYAETGYGYVERGAPLPGVAGSWRVARFHEKPDAARAQQYLDGGCCFWNSGIFLFVASEMARLLRRHLPEMEGSLDRLRQALRAGGGEGAWSEYFEAAPSISIDNGVMERADQVAVVKASFEWSDLGNWTSLGDRMRPDAQGNRCRGEVVSLDSEGCVLFSADGGLLAVMGVNDLIVVRVGDATLVCPRNRAQEVRRLVREGKADERLKRFF